MKKSEFRTPLLQSAAVLAGVIFLATLAASAGSESSGGFLSIIAGIGKIILFIIGLAVGLGTSIILLIGIFLAAVAMVSPEQAKGFYSDLKKNFARIVLNCSEFRSCCDLNDSMPSLHLGDYHRMKEELLHLKESNLELSNVVKEMGGKTCSLQEKIDLLEIDNSSIRGKIEELEQTIIRLSDSGNSLNELVTKFITSTHSGSNSEMIDQVPTLESQQIQDRNSIENLALRLAALELGMKLPLTSGIFAYIKNEKDQKIFIEQVNQALKQEMTYTQIDEFLSNTLSTDLDQTIKEHPSLTRTYIRSLRKD